MLPIRTDNSSRDKSMYLIKRVALDRSGRLGSLYDGYHDQILEFLKDGNQQNSHASRETPRCEIVRGSNDQYLNILKMARIEEELRLSIVLNLREKNGVAKIAFYAIPVSECTRLFCYTYINQVQQLSDDPEDTQQIIERVITQTKATHIITGVDWGINIVVILELPANDDTIMAIDRVLQRLRMFLLCDGNSSPLEPDEKKILKKIVHTRVYSNILDLSSSMALIDVCRYIQQNKDNDVDHPVSYTLRPITWLYPQYNGEGTKFVPLAVDLNHDVELYIIQIRANMRILEMSVSDDVPKLLSGCLREQLLKAQKQWDDMKARCKKEIERFSKLVFEVRCGRVEMSKIDEALKGDERMTLENMVRSLKQILHDLAEKGHFIIDLDRFGFRYLNVVEHDITRADTERAMECILIVDDQHDRILCSKDLLNKNNPEQLLKLRWDLVDAHKNNTNLNLIYADFSYSSFELHYMMILPSGKHNNEKNKLVQKETSSYREIQNSVTPIVKVQTSTSTSVKVEPTVPSFMKTQVSVPALTKVDFTVPSTTNAQLSTPPPIKVQTTDPLPSSLLTTNTINILLLGETGAGKSTFINAFVNYLKFKTLNKAQSSKPIVVIPVSFLITVGDNFEEHTLEFGDLDSSHNEDFDHPGQSVTQRCKSYLFRFDHIGGKNLRIIDTPGFGDTRGLDQDDRNMQHILEYINNLSHLNAICFLLKPNASRLDISFRTCLTQLFNLLEPNARNNIIFCFTNARSTFYTPGDTAPLLKKMLSSFTITDIPFKKENTFCFDNESFRYLIALQNDIQFSDEEKHEYEMSWSTSVTQSNHLIDYIRNKLPVYQITGKLQSIKHAQFQILHMIRPMLEAMRNILRNLILHKMNLLKESIELRPKPIYRPATLCLSCKPCQNLVGRFLVAQDIPHEIHKDCRRCRCPLNQHVPTYYVLEYELSNVSPHYNQNQMTDMLHQLCHASAEFANFLVHIVCFAKDDPFLVGLVQMIMEENYFYTNSILNCLNSHLANALRDLQSKYEHQMNEISQCQRHNKLSDIYNLITTIRKHSMIHEQLTAHNNGQKMMMKQGELEIPIDLTSA
jgi:GTP-binding protein EngB required for normal cell division